MINLLSIGTNKINLKINKEFVRLKINKDSLNKRKLQVIEFCFRYYKKNEDYI